MTENLQRVTAKIFAGDADSSKVGQFGSALIGSKVETTDVNEIQALPAYTLGWSQAVLTSRNYPTYQEMNGVMKVLSYQNAYIAQKGIPEYDPNTTYYAGDMCKGVRTGILYTSRTDNNLGNDPTTSPTYWKEFEGTSSIPATNYIAEMSGNISYEGNTLNIPTMTLYAPNGRNEDKTLTNEIIAVEQGQFEVTGQGKYNLFYNGTAKNLVLAINYAKRTDKEPLVIFTNDVWYKTDNYMYFNDTIYPNYTISDAVDVTSDGIVSNLGTLSLNVAWNVGKTPSFNLKFKTGSDVTNLQSLFSLPFASAVIENSQVTVSLYGNSYTVDYYSTLYNGSYSLTNTQITYSYTIEEENTIYSSLPLAQGITVYNDSDLIEDAGVITNLNGNNVTVSQIEQVYDGAFTLISSDSYYTYQFGDEETNYYTSAPLATDVIVYTDTDLQDVYGKVASVTSNTVLIQQENEVYTGEYVQNPNVAIYTYTIGNETVYTNQVFAKDVEVYNDKTFENIYGTVQSLTSSNVIVQSVNTSTGYVAKSAKQYVPANVTIYSDVDLKNTIDTSTGINATYTGVYQKSNIGTLTYDVTAETDYNGSLTYNGTSYILNLNNTGSNLISDNEPYSYTTEVTLGGNSAFLGSYDLKSVTIPSIWTWNNLNNSQPNWVKASLVELGDITIIDGQITELNINEPIELVKMTDIKDFADKNLTNTNKMSDCILGYREPLSYETQEDSAVITLPAETKVLFADGLNVDNMVQSLSITTVEPITLTIDKYSQSNNIVYLQYINKTLSLQYTDEAFYFESDVEPAGAINTDIQYIWRSSTQNKWFTGNVNGWKQIYAVKVGEFTGSLENYITGLTVESPIRIDGGNFVKKTGDTMTGALNFNLRPYTEMPGTNNPPVGCAVTVPSGYISYDGTNMELDINDISTPEKTKFGTYVRTFDKNHNLMGQTGFGFNPKQNFIYDISVFRYVNGVRKVSNIYPYITKDGTVGCHATQVADASNTTDIATTNWVRRTLNTSGLGLGTWSKTTNGYIKLTNGIIIQWGHISAPSAIGNLVVKFPVSFTNQYYGMGIIRSGSNANLEYPCHLTAHNLTQMTLYITSKSSQNWIAIGY